MTKSAASHLDEILTFYTPSPTYFTAARGHRHAIETRLDLNLGVREMFETGSLSHGTGVACWSDADYMVSLKGIRPSSETALRRVKAELVSRFPSTDIVIRRPAVVCRFNNSKETVEIVPAYAAESGYWIPDPAGDWMKSFPKDHNSYVSEANQQHSGGAKKLARLAKVWKYKRSVPASSCYLEMRAAKYANDESSWFITVEIYRYLNSLKAISLAAMNDPTGLGSRFTAYSSDSNKADALSKLDTAVSHAFRAMNFSTDGKDDEAIDQYKLLFNQ